MPPRLTEAEIEKLRILYEESPLSIPALTRETGHSHRTIYWYASSRGWKSRAVRRQPRLPRAEIRALYEDTIVPVAEIARLAHVAVPTIHAWAAKEGWTPRATRLRGGGAGAEEIVDLAAEVAAACERAKEEEYVRAGRESVARSKALLREAQSLVREQQRAARERRKKGGSYRRAWYSPQDLAARGLDGRARVYLPRPDRPAPRRELPSHGWDESE